jgi:hypothetical protein
LSGGGVGGDVGDFFFFILFGVCPAGTAGTSVIFVLLVPPGLIDYPNLVHVGEFTI